jgi:hypothetical protein
MTQVIFKTRRKIAVKHGKPSLTGLGITGQNKRALTGGNIDRYRTKKGITLSIMPPLIGDSNAT